MGETVAAEDAGGTKVTAAARPTIAVPPRGSFESYLSSGSVAGFSPGPMTLVSNFFSEQGSFSFSQLLAMASPVAKPGFSPLPVDKGNLEGKEGNSDEKTDVAGYKRNRPVSLVVTQPQPQLQAQSFSPLFMIPSGLSPSGLLNSPGFLSPLQSPFGMSHQQALAHVTAQAALSQSYMQMQAEYQRTSSSASAEPLAHHSTSAPNEIAPAKINSLPSELESSKVESSEVSQSEVRKAAPLAVDKPASDGYNWRKYGQKQVKASECPRSYYKCTQLNCPVKKKVERSLDGHITEITYKGQHNHDPPQPVKRQKDILGLSKLDTTNSQVKPLLGSGQTETSKLSEPAVSCPETTITEAQSQPSSQQLPLVKSHDKVEGNVITLDEEDDNEPLPKRRSVDIGDTMPVSSHKTVTESKIVVQTRSEVDLLDDGYKWRKYGQKVVKGNPYPRSYYRCTYAGCNVRKHVERSSLDPKAVITTYEGKHCHEIPAGRNSSHSLVNNTTSQTKPQEMVSSNLSLHKEMDFQNKDQLPIVLQLKEEQIAA